MQARASARVATLGVALAWGGGCTLGAYDGVAPRAADFEVRIPGVTDRVMSDADSDGPGILFAVFRDSVVGVQAQVEPAALDLELVAGALEGHREHHRDGEGRVYGPFEDPAGRDAAWVVVARGNALSVGLEVGVDGETETIMDGQQDAAISRWTLWSGRHAAGLGADGPAPGAAAREVVIESRDDVRAMTIRSRLDMPNDPEDPLGPVFDEGVSVSTDADGGWIQLRSAAPLPAGIVTFTPATNPWFSVSWRASVGPIVATVEGPSGTVEIRECVDALGRAVYRSVEPESAAVPGQTFGAVTDCLEAETVVPAVPGT